MADGKGSIHISGNGSGRVNIHLFSSRHMIHRIVALYMAGNASVFCFDTLNSSAAIHA